MKQFILTSLGILTLAGCVDGRNPNVGVGVAIGGNAPPPIIASGPQGGPPPWAPAHGRRAREARYRYYYYPSSGVYVNIQTGSYFYLNGGNWQVAMSLPSTVILDTNNYVSLELETDRPYLYYESHKAKYRGHGHGHKHGHGKRHGNRGWKDND